MKYFLSDEIFSVSTPRGDLSLHVGSEPVELFCHLNPNHTYYSQQVIKKVPE